MRQKPILKYCGLTVILSGPSRFDQRTGKLLSANGGNFFNNECLSPETNVMQCDVRTFDCTDAYLPGTVCVLVLGEVAAQKILAVDNLLGQIRGTPYMVAGLPHIASFSPQDAVDPTDFESQSRGFEVHDLSKDAVDEKTHHGRTARKNFGFWLMHDTKRALSIIKNGIPTQEPAKYVIAPKQEEIMQFLGDTKDTDLYFDIETDADLHITCFAISTLDSPVFTIPLLDWNYKCYYSKTESLLRGLSGAVVRNTLVAHNGAAFDFLVLPFKYGIPLGRRLYDTMIAHHRCYPLVEKSLGHCTSLWTYELFHKDESDFSYNSPQSCMRLWSYCGKDVHTMRLIKSAISDFARRIPGLESSISQAMDSIRPYITMMLQGIHYRQDLVEKIVHENDRLMTHYIKWVPWLVGADRMSFIKGSGKSSMLGSSAQCARYFHDVCGYPVINRSEKTNEPSLGKREMFKLRLKHENPLIDLCIAYRELQKESGSLKFRPWKNAAVAEQQKLCLDSTLDTNDQVESLTESLLAGS